MSLNYRLPDTETAEKDESVPEELAELGRLVQAGTAVSHADLLAAFQKVSESVRRRHRILLLVQEALSQLRLDIKYLMFDLEVTRKERDELREQLEGR